MRSRTAFLIAILFSIVSGPAWADKRVALVIGNSAYQNAPKLANPSNDAAAIADLLLRAGFEVVESKRDLTNTEMRRVLRDFSNKSRDADMAVVYYAGHGIEVDGVNYLVPIDAVLEQDSDAFDETVQLDRVLQAIEPAKRLRLVILDACRENPFARTMKRNVASRALGRGLAGVEPGKPNTLIAFAAKGGSTAADGAGRNSPFAVALLKHLTTPGLDLRQAFGRIRDDVMKATDNKQEPFVYGSLGGATVTLVPAAPVQSAAPTQPSADPLAGVRKDYEFALQINTREGWDSFVAQYPNGFYANLAKAQLGKIAAEEAQRAAADKVKQAEAERARLAAAGAQAAEQAKAARDAKAAEDARIAADKLRQAEQAKAEAAERARAGAERTAAEKLAKQKAEAEARAIREKAQAEVKAIREKAQADAKAAEEARRAAETEVSRLREAALNQTKDDKPADMPARVAALPPDTGKATLTPQELNRSLQAELRRVGCFTAASGDEWTAAAERSLALFNRHVGMKLDVKFASIDALDTVRAKKARVCPLICERGFHASGDRCEKIEPRKPVAKGEAASEPKRGQATGASGLINCNSGGCQPVPKGCRFGLSTTSTRERNVVVCD